MTENVRWKEWADNLRQEMMTGLTPQVSKTVDEIIAETQTTKSENTLRSERFWQSCQAGKSPNDVLTTAGFEIEFEPDEARRVNEVTLQLNQSWNSILQRVLDRQKR